MTKLSAKQRMLNALSKTEGYNTFTVEQARRRFGISNVSARIDELRQEGHVIYTNTKRNADGVKVASYRLGKPTKAMVRTALKAGYSLA
jgi:predicted transcriptional regulator